MCINVQRVKQLFVMIVITKKYTQQKGVSVRIINRIKKKSKEAIRDRKVRIKREDREKSQ